MNDMVFSFAEIGFQEFETQKYLGKVLRENGFTVEDGVAGIPTAWVARCGSGQPVIAFGSDIDGIPQGSQNPGVADHDPLVEGAPGYGDDDIGDVTWSVPTVSLSYPANFQTGPGHNGANAIPMATPIAHKGVNAGAPVQALTALDLVLRPELLGQTRDYFENVRLKQRTYTPFMRESDQPAIWMNKATMERYRPEMRQSYFDPTKHRTCLDQMKEMFGYTYPTVRTE